MTDTATTDLGRVAYEADPSGLCYTWNKIHPEARRVWNIRADAVRAEVEREMVERVEARKSLDVVDAATRWASGDIWSDGWVAGYIAGVRASLAALSGQGESAAIAGGTLSDETGVSSR